MLDRNTFKSNIPQYSSYKITDNDPIGELWDQQEADRQNVERAKRKAEEQNCLLPNIDQELLNCALPKIVVDYLSRYEDNNQKDVFVLSLLAHLSGILPNYFVIHDGDELTTNLNVFITAPAGSGKSAMSHATKFFYSIDDELSEIDEEEKSHEAVTDEKIFTQKTLFIPANNSSAAITKCLSNNGGRGIICETEADTLGNILTKDWANFDDILRKAFHNEPITMSRASLTKIIKIPNPALSVILTGTPQQVVKLIPSTENGLFSRFLYYYFASDNTWRDVFSSNKDGNKQVNDNNSELSEIMSAIYFTRLEGKKMYFSWTDEQAVELNDFFSQLLYEASNIYGSAITSVVFRLGLIATRLGAIISFINSFWETIIGPEELKETINADKGTFALVKHLIEILLEHSLYVYIQLPRSMDRSFSESSKKQSFYNMLPDKFSRDEAIKIYAPKAFIKTRTADGYLSDFVKNKTLERGFQNNYIKPNKF